MTSVLDVKVDNVEGYVLHEAEILLTKLGEAVGESDTISLKLDRDELLYRVLVSVDRARKRFTTQASSRDLKEALEDSCLKMINLLLSFPSYGAYQPT